MAGPRSNSVTPRRAPAISLRSMKITKTRNGLRLSQHGVVISELRTSAGPTHSVFDVLAALIAVLHREGRVGVLGFAGGGMIAPLRHLGVVSRIHSVDLDRDAYDLFLRHCPAWAKGVEWDHADAQAWLRRQAPNFGLLMDDLSIARGGDVFKPDLCWQSLPGLIRQRLKPGGYAVFNLLRPACGAWNPDLRRVADAFAATRLIELDEFENRILIGGDELPSARVLGAVLRQALRRLRSRQAERIRVRRV